MPLPPPPAEAFIIIGSPIFCAILTASSEFFIIPLNPGTTLTFALLAIFLDSILSPIFFIALDGGAINIIPSFSSS